MRKDRLDDKVARELGVDRKLVSRITTEFTRQLGLALAGRAEVYLQYIGRLRIDSYVTEKLHGYPGRHTVYIGRFKKSPTLARQLKETNGKVRS